MLRLPVRSANGLVDRLLRGRAWVACVGALLAGIVFLNVSLLGLNSGIAVSADQASELRRQNADLRLEVAKLGATERIQRVAESRGFVMPAPGEVTYVDADPERDGRKAALALEKKRSTDTFVEGTEMPEPAPEAAAVGEAPLSQAETSVDPGAAPAAPAAGAVAAPVPEAATEAPGGSTAAGVPAG